MQCSSVCVLHLILCNIVDELTFMILNKIIAMDGNVEKEELVSQSCPQSVTDRRYGAVGSPQSTTEEQYSSIEINSSAELNNIEIQNDPLLLCDDDMTTVQLPPPPDGGWGWAVVFGSFMIHLIADGIAYSFGVFLEDFVVYFDASHGSTSLLSSLMIGVTWGSGPIATALMNLYGARTVTMLGSLIAACGFIISIFSPNIIFMYFSFGIMSGFGMGLAYMPSIVIISFYFEKQRALAVGLALCGTGLGTFIFGPLGESLIQYYGSWKAAILIEAALLLNGLVCGALFRPLKTTKWKRTAKFHQTTYKDSKTSGSLLKSSSKSPKQKLRCTDILDFAILKNVVFIVFGISNFLAAMGYGVPFVFLPDRAINLGFTRAKAAILVSVLGITNLLGRLVFGFISDRKCVNRLMLFSTVLVISGISTIGSSLCTNYPSLALYAGIYGCLTGAYVGLTTVVLVDLLGLQKLSSSFGLLLFIMGVAAVLGPPIAGVMYDVTQNYDVSFYLMGALIFLSGAILYPLPCIQRSQNLSNHAQPLP